MHNVLELVSWVVQRQFANQYCCCLRQGFSSSSLPPLLCTKSSCIHMTCAFLVNHKGKHSVCEVLISSLCKLRSFSSLLFRLQKSYEQILCQKYGKFMVEHEEFSVQSRGNTFLFYWSISNCMKYIFWFLTIHWETFFLLTDFADCSRPLLMLVSTHPTPPNFRLILIGL